MGGVSHFLPGEETSFSPYFAQTINKSQSCVCLLTEAQPRITSAQLFVIFVQIRSYIHRALCIILLHFVNNFAVLKQKSMH